MLAPSSSFDATPLGAPKHRASRPPPSLCSTSHEGSWRPRRLVRTASRWREYGGKGSGYAIGYRPSTLARSGRLLKCVYDESALKEQLRFNYSENIVPLLDEVLRQRSGLPAEYLVPTQVNEGLLAYFRSMAAGYKHVGYSEEVEWRLVVNASKGTRCYRTSPARGVVPYRELKIAPPNQPSAKEPSSVVVGPTQDPIAGYAAAAFLLEDNEFVNVEGVLRQSVIPYRG